MKKNNQCSFCKVLNPILPSSVKKIFEHTSIAGLCYKCAEYEKIELDCSVTYINPKNFMCTKCSLNNTRVKNCPSCNTLVSKNGGCNHIECYCGANWCWICLRHNFDQCGHQFLDN